MCVGGGVVVYTENTPPRLKSPQNNPTPPAGGGVLKTPLKYSYGKELSKHITLEQQQAGVIFVE